MAAYYYLISSLPTLKTDEPMPLSYDEFLLQCKSAVKESTYKLLCSLDVSSDSLGIGFVKKWTAFNGSLMKELNRRRKEKFGKKVESDMERNSEIEKVVNLAMNARNPLEAEKILLDAQFSYLDSLVSMHFFDDNVLFGYAVKLKLLERQNVFETENGKQEFSRLYNSIHQQIMNIGLEN